MAHQRFATHMTDQDALMWNMEKDPELRSTIVTTVFLEEVPDWGRFVERMEIGTRLIPRMRQRVLSPPMRLGPPRWSYDPSFDIGFHLKRYRLPDPADTRTLLDLTEPIAASSFDRARPPWEATLFEGLEGGRAAVVLKLHHSVTDGVGGMQLAGALLDVDADADPPEAPEPPPGERFDRIALVRDSLGHTSRRWQGIAARLPGTVLRGLGSLVADPTRTAAELLRTTRSVVKLLQPVTAPMSPIMVERSLGRRLDMLELSVDDLKRAAKAANGTLNDAFVAAVLGGMWNYHERHKAPVAQLRMTMPINIRTEDDEGVAGNQFTPARFPVPLTLADPLDRMRRIRTLVVHERGEPALHLTSALAGVLNRLPTSLVTVLFGSMLKGIDFVTSNVPGAPVPVYLAGARIDGFYAFGPPSGSGANITLISHVDKCCVGVVTDSAAVPDPEVFLECLREGFDEVIALG